MNIFYLIYLTCGIIVAYNVILFILRTPSYEYFADVPVSDGAKGEKFIFDQVNKVPVKKQGAPNLILIDKEKTQSTEIDVIFILPSGLYVFESKNKKGHIAGDVESEDEWLAAKLYDEIDSEEFFNPVLQNDLHIRIMKEYFDLNDIPIHSVVAFGDNCKLDIRNKKSRKDVKIIKYSKIKRYLFLQEIKSLFNKKRVSGDIIKKIGEQIVSTQVENQKYKNIHKENVAHNHSEEEDKNESKKIDLENDKVEYIKELLREGMKIEDVASVNFLDVETVKQIADQV